MNYSDLAQKHISQVELHYRNGLIFDRYNRFAKGELFILNYLCKRGETAMPSEISLGLGSSTSRIANALGVLEKKGRITREIDKRDRRKIIVSITQTGKEVVQNEREQLVNREAHIFEMMGDAEAKEFVRLHKRYLELAEQEK